MSRRALVDPEPDEGARPLQSSRARVRTGTATRRPHSTLAVQGSSTRQTGYHLDREALLHEWGRVVADRRLHATEESAGTDIVPPLIGWLANQKELTAESTSFEPMVRDLAYARLEEGCPLRVVVGDCSMLRECILRVATTELDPNSPEARQGTVAAHRWLDRAVAVVVAVYTEAKDRSLRGIDRVSAAFARSANVEELLQRLIDAFQDVGPRVDAAAIALTEDDHVRIHAASGVAEHLEGKALKLGEGFIGRLVAEKRSLALRFRDADPMALPQGMSRSGLRTIYGAPMIEGEEVLGVALMGSCTVFDFPKDERLVFDVMARHATSAIRSQKIRESLGRETARMDALLASMPAGVVVADGPSGKMILHNPQAETVWRRSFPPSTSLDARDEWVAYTRDGRRVEPEAWALSRAIRTGETVLDQEVDILRGDGTRGTILNSAAPILAEGTRIIGGVATFSDITDKRKTENQLQTALAQAQRAETFHRILAEAGQELAESVDKESTLRTIANLAVPKLADYCGLFVADDRGPLTIRHFAAIDPVKAARLHEYQQANLERLHDDPQLLNPAMQEAFERGELKIFDHVTDEVLVRAAAGNQALLALLRGLGVTSVVIVPMIARGRALGVAVFAQMTASRELLPGDVDLAEALTQCSALALDNHLLYRSAQEAAHQREENPRDRLARSSERPERRAAQRRAPRHQADARRRPRARRSHHLRGPPDGSLHPRSARLHRDREGHALHREEARGPGVDREVERGALRRGGAATGYCADDRRRRDAPADLVRRQQDRSGPREPDLQCPQGHRP